MKPAMRMLAMDKLRQEPQSRSEYGGNTNRRMIGFDRDYERERSGPEMNAYGYAANREWPANREWGYPPIGAYNGPEMTYDRREEYQSRMGGYPEARRRRDSRGRYAMGDMEYDMEDTEDYFPRSMAGNRPRARHGGSTYGDIYAEGTIYAPAAMNRPMGGMMGGDMAEPVDEQTARMWVMRMDAGEHFKPEVAEQYRTALCPHCEKWEYFVAINAMYSDYCETAKKMGIDKPEFYAHMAKDFLLDKDAGPHKLRKYMTTIPK